MAVYTIYFMSLIVRIEYVCIVKKIPIGGEYDE